MYLFFLGVVPLPVTPGALTIKTPSLNKTVTLVNDGEINIPKTSGLREISFEFLLPQLQKYPFANYQLNTYTASVMIPLLNAWKNTMLPFRFIVVRTTPKGMPLFFTYIKCVIEDFQYDEDAEAHGMDVMCSINLKEYKDYGTKSVSINEVDGNNTATVKTSRPTNRTVPTKVKAKQGDTLPSISKKWTGSFYHTDGIAEANGFKFKANMDELLKGTFKTTRVSPDGSIHYDYTQYVPSSKSILDISGLDIVLPINKTHGSAIEAAGRLWVDGSLKTFGIGL